MKPQRSARLAVPVVVASLALLVTGCSGDEDAAAPDGRSDVEASSDIDVPARIAEAGKLNIGAYLQYPPYRYVDENGDNVGLEIEMAQAIAGKLGVDAEFNDVNWDAIIPAMETGRYDLALGQMTIESIAPTEGAPPRAEVVDIFSWLNIAENVVVATGNPDGIDPNDMCGTSAAAVEGSSEAELQRGWSEDCVDTGAEPIEVTRVSDTAGMLQAVLTDRAQWFMLDPGVASYLSEQNGDQVEILDDPIEDFPSQPAGWVFGNDDVELVTAFSQAIAELKSDGTWDDMFEKYGVPQTSIIDEPTRDGLPIE